MRLKIRICLALILLLVLTALPGRAAGMQEVLRATLDNGLRVVIVRNTLAPVVTTQMNYLAGSNEAPEGFPGTAHALEHMMFRGSPGLSAEQLANIIALTGGQFNADTQQTVTQYYFTVSRDQLETALHVEAVRMRGLLCSEDLWKQERGAIEQEVARDLSSPEYVLSMKLLEGLFSGTPYAHDALGTRPSFQRTTGAMLKKFYDRWYAPNNAVLVIAGDVDPQKTLAKVRELFEPIPRRTIPARPAVELKPLAPAALALDTDLPYGLAVVAYRLPGFDSEDFAAGLILADVLDSRRGNLYALVPEGKALYTNFEVDALPKAGFGNAVAAYPHGGDGNALVTAIKDIITGYVRDGVPAGLVEAAKRHEANRAQFRKNSVPGLAGAWSQAVAVEGRTAPDDVIAAVEKVTADDVARVAREYLDNDTAITAVLTPRPAEKPATSRASGRGESFAPDRMTSDALPDWAEKADTVPALPPSKVKPVVTRLSNGIRLIVQTESISPTVTVIGRVKNNTYLSEPAGKEGVSSILEDLFDYGTVSLDRLAFQKAQDDIGADISVGASFSCRSSSDRFEQATKLLADNLLRPALPETAFAVVKEETIAALAGRIRSPGYLSGRALREGLFPEADPALRDATPETAAAVSLQDVKSYYQQVFRPDMTTIVVIGDVSAKQARAAITRYFGAWKAAGARPKTDLPAVPPNRPSLAAVPDASRIQDEVVLAETIGVTRSHPDYYRLELGNRVLSGAFYASRLYRDLREKAGLVYTVGSVVEAGKHRSLFRIVYGCDPPNVAKARAMVEKDLADMRTDPVTPEELKRAKILLLRQIALSEASTDAVAGRLLSLSLQDLPLDETRRAARRYRDMTAAQVRDAFKKWIRPAGFVQVTVGPNPQ